MLAISFRETASERTEILMLGMSQRTLAHAMMVAVDVITSSTRSTCLPCRLLGRSTKVCSTFATLSEGVSFV